MFERFTDRARKVMALANQEAQRFHHDHIGTGHILLGLVKEGSGLGATVLKKFDMDIKKLRLELAKHDPRGSDMVTMGKLPQTSHAKAAIEYAHEEARALKHNYVNTEHVLLGLLRVSDGWAAKVLMSLGLKLDDVREELLNLLGGGDIPRKRKEESEQMSLQGIIGVLKNWRISKKTGKDFKATISALPPIAKTYDILSRSKGKYGAKTTDVLNLLGSATRDGSGYYPALLSAFASLEVIADLEKWQEEQRKPLDEFKTEDGFREAFIKFLREKKGYPSDSFEFLPKDAPDLAIYDIETRMILAFIDFKRLKEQGVLGIAVQNLRFSMQSVFAGYIVCPGFDKLYKPFDIFEVTDTDEPESISHNAFPNYEELKQKVAGKKLTLSDFEVGLSKKGIEICEKVIELAEDSKIGLHSEIVDKSYIDLTLSGLVNYRNNVVVQIHRYGGAKTVIALAVVGPKKGTVWKEPELNDFVIKGNTEKLSGYKKNIPREKAWLNGNVPKKGTREKAAVYVIYPETKGTHWEGLGAVERLFKWTVENYRREDEKWKIDPAEPEREMSADEFYVADGKTKKDQLGFMPYVKAVAAFLTHARTQPPLTMSVEGEWGSGKSSFMWQLQDEIKRIYAEQGKRKCFIVEFVPWRHDKDEALWAAFALRFIGQVSGKLGLSKRLYANMSLKLTQYNWREGWADFAKVVGLLIVWLVVTGVLVTLVYKGVPLEKDGNIELPGWIGSTAVIAGALFVALGKVKDFLGSPLAVDLKKYMKKPDYVSKISFIEKFHKDFKEIVKSYAGNERVYVFIDDLDRCRVPKAAELMESINLMISEEPNLMFIMGMDREKVAAGLAVKHEKLLDYLSSQVDVESSSERKDKRMRGIRYGYSFMEKFIQIPFILPIPRQGWIEEMLLDLAGQRSGIKKELNLRKRTKWSRISGMISKLRFPIPSVLKTYFMSVLKLSLKSKTIVDKKKRPITKEEKEEQIVTDKVDAAVKKVFGDDENFRRIVQMVSPYLKYNPRRVKQFVNLFRLRYVTAMSTNLFEQEDGKQLTFEQLGKFVGIGLGWPLFIKGLERNYKLLDALVDIAEGKKMAKKVAERIKEWAEDEKLIGLIKSGCFDENKKKKTRGEYERFSMRELDVEKLMKVAPRVKQMEME